MKTISLSLAAILTCGVIASADSADIGVINVDSTTIDDRFNSKKTEVSNTITINGEKVDKTHGENIQQALNSIPGLTTEIQSGDSLKLHIRGVENQRYMGEKPGVAVVIDGVPVFERTGRVNIDLDNIDSIKVIKGGASYLFGEDALSGAVIITTKKGAKNSYNSIAYEKGSFGFEKYLARAGFSNDKINASLQVSERKSNGYWEDSDYKSKYLNSKLQYQIDNTSDLTFGLELSDRNKDSHGTVKGVTQATINPKSIDDGTGANRDYSRMYDVGLQKYFLTYSKSFSDTSNLLVNIYQYNDDTKFVSGPIKYDTTGNPVTDPDAYAMQNDYSQIQRGIKSEYRTSKDKFAGMIGLDIRDNYYENKAHILKSYASKIRPRVIVVNAGTVTQNNKTDENVYALYGEAKYALNDKLTLTTNARYDHLEMDYLDNLSSLNLDKSFDVGSFRLGASYKLNNDNDVYFNTSTGFRTPTVDQLFAGEISPTGTTLSNHDLKPETSYNYEIGFRGKNDLFEYNTALFWLERDDYIMAASGQYANIDPTIPGDKNQYQNIGGMRSRGLEASLNSNKKDKFYYGLAYAYTDAKFTKYDNFNLLLGNPYGVYTTQHYNLAGYDVPRVPNHTLNLSGNYNINENLLLTTEYNLKSSHYADELNRVKIPAYGVVNLLASYSKKIGNKKWEFFTRVDNLLDKNYYNTARGGSDGDYNGIYNAEDISITVNPGRVITAGLSVKF